MASNFYARQDRARTNTVWLVVLFLIAVIGIVAATSGTTFAVLKFSADPSTSETVETPWQVPMFVGIATVIVIALGSLYKVAWLRVGGGPKVAESLGGVRLNPATEDFEERRLLNIVEEMALASGTPVPPVYMLPENSINAFAAGYTPNTAVIGVTRGAATQLTREQLQGVIAHEFSHILNGDMRMSIRLIGVLHGILLLGLLGRVLFHIFIHSGRRSSNDKGSGQIVILAIVVGVALILIGSIGSFIGNLIKAAVSRQREYLADSSAVQFTRNPSGISGALKRIGGFSDGSTVKHASAAEVSHMFFAEGIAHGFASWLASHPPLPARILAIEPDWNRQFITAAPPQENQASGPALQRHAHAAASGFAPQATGLHPVQTPNVPVDAPLRSSEVQDSLEHIGDPHQLHRQYAAQLVQEIPDGIKSAAHDPFGARAVIFALLLDEDAKVREAQLKALYQAIEPQVVQLTERLYKTIANLPARLRLPVIDVSSPALLSMTEPQYQTFMASLHALIVADSRLSIFEWSLSQIVIQHLRPNYVHVPPPRVQYYSLHKLLPQASHLVSIIAHVGNNPEHSQFAFQAGAKLLPEIEVQWLPPDQCSLKRLEADLSLLRQTAFKLRGQLLDACTACVCADAEILPAEAELLRGIAELLDCPMPPVLPGMRL